MSEAEETARILETFNAYVKTFERFDVSNVVRYYHYPSIMITPRMTVSLRTPVHCGVMMGLAMAMLRRRGYARSEVSSLRVEMLGKSLALTRADCVRYKKDDTVLQQFRMSYMMRKAKDRWLIIAAGITEAA